MALRTWGLGWLHGGRHGGADHPIRNLNEGLKKRLRVRAAEQSTSMEDEARSILRAAVAEDPSTPAHLGVALHELFAPIGGVELELPEREDMRQTLSFA